MPGRPGQPLTRKEVEEIEAYNAAGVARPAKYDDAVYDGTAGIGTYRWATTEEKRSAADASRDAAKTSAEAHKMTARVRDLVEGRGYREEENAEEGSPFADTGAFQPPSGNVTTAPTQALTGPVPMPASLANALRDARPVNRSTKAASRAEDSTPVESAPVSDAKPADEAGN